MMIKAKINPKIIMRSQEVRLFGGVPEQKSGIRISDNRPPTDVFEDIEGFKGDEGKENGAMNVLKELHEQMKVLNIRSNEAKYRLIAAGYEVAIQLNDDPVARATFYNDEFWVGELRMSTPNGMGLFRRVIMRILGGPEQSSKASEWTVPLKSAFKAKMPPASVPSILANHAKSKTKERKEKAAVKARAVHTGRTVKLGRIKGTACFVGITKAGTTSTLTFGVDTAENMRVTIFLVPVKQGESPSTISCVGRS